MRITKRVLTKLLLVALSSYPAWASDAADGQRSTGKTGKKQTTPSVRCHQVKKSSRRSPGPILPCGPNVPAVDTTAISARNIVVVRVVLAKTGEVISVQPISGDHVWYDKAVEEIKATKFTPRRISGRAVKTELIVNVIVDSGQKR